MRETESGSVSTAGEGPGAPGAGADPLTTRIAGEIAAAGGWIGFERYMALALYEPGLGYYARDSRQFGAMPSSGSDFVTAPELSPLFGRALARQVAQALQASGTTEVIEFGAGSGALAGQLLEALDEATGSGAAPVRYRIVELSAALRERQRERLARWEGRVEWLDTLPEAIEGVVVGNEVLDAMPVALLHWDGERWFERGVALEAALGEAPATVPATATATAAAAPAPIAGPTFAWQDRPTDRRPPVDGSFVPGTTVEIHPQAEAFIATLAGMLRRGAAFFIDYGFPQDEYYHPQRRAGTLVCHRAHRTESGDAAPLEVPGSKDITAHVDFTGIALAGQEAGLDVIGYTSQGRFLLNCGLVEAMAAAGVADRIAAQRLVHEHEMGELFKVVAFARGCDFEPIGFTAGDRLHRL